jgi:hypothetical protein
LLVLTILSLKNNRNYGYVWSNAFISIGLAMATKLLLNFSVIVVILLILWISLTSVCIYRFKKDKKKSGSDSVQVIKPVVTKCTDCNSYLLFYFIFIQIKRNSVR